MRGLVVGRFQPLHKGHDSVIRTAIEDCVKVAVAVGSSAAKPSPTNPFSFEERKQMLEATYGDAIQVYAVPDIHDPPNWTQHLLAITGPVDRAFGNDERTISLLEDDGIKVIRTGLKTRENFEGDTIRLQMAEGDGHWRKSVPPTVLPLLDEWEATVRLRRLEAQL